MIHKRITELSTATRRLYTFTTTPPIKALLYKATIPIINDNLKTYILIITFTNLKVDI